MPDVVMVVETKDDTRPVLSSRLGRGKLREGGGRGEGGGGRGEGGGERGGVEFLF